jgi:hypothetical protein
MAEHGNYSASFKNVLTGVLEFQVGFSRKSMLLASSGAKGGASALEIAKKHFHLWWKYQSYFSFPSLMTTLT